MVALSITTCPKPFQSYQTIIKKHFLIFLFSVCNMVLMERMLCACVYVCAHDTNPQTSQLCEYACRVVSRQTLYLHLYQNHPCEGLPRVAYARKTVAKRFWALTTVYVCMYGFCRTVYHLLTNWESVVKGLYIIVKNLFLCGETHRSLLLLFIVV